MRRLSIIFLLVTNFIVFADAQQVPDSLVQPKLNAYTKKSDWGFYVGYLYANTPSKMAQPATDQESGDGNTPVGYSVFRLSATTNNIFNFSFGCQFFSKLGDKYFGVVEIGLARYSYSVTAKDEIEESYPYQPFTSFETSSYNFNISMFNLNWGLYRSLYKCGSGTVSVGVKTFFGYAFSEGPSSGYTDRSSVYYAYENNISLNLRLDERFSKNWIFAPEIYINQYTTQGSLGLSVIGFQAGFLF